VNALVSDTHAVIWYYAGDPALSARARNLIDATIRAGDSIVVASISLVEVAYLIEKGRIPAATFDLLMSALADPAYHLVLAPLDAEVAETLRRVPRADVPDMPDRIIAATALHLGLPLVSRDRKIQASTIHTIW
jgi:PIN domain nuclease of toxin-antitoxin system